MLMPIYLLVVMSLKSPSDLREAPFSFPTSPEFENYPTAWQGATAGVSLGDSSIDSLTITIGSVMGVVTLGSLGAWTLARSGSRLSTGLYMLFVIGIIMPLELGIIPLYAAMRHLGLVGTAHGMILLNVGHYMPLSVFFYASFVRALPKEYEEAARVDGASLFRTFVRVVFPMLRPVHGSVAVVIGLITWNEFFLPLIFLAGSDTQTLPLGVYAFVGEFSAQWTLIFAAVTISIVPVLAFFLFAQRQLIHGFAGGIRG